MSKLRKLLTGVLFLISLIGLCFATLPSTSFAMGMGWGDDEEDECDHPDDVVNASCIPDNPLVIYPGPIGSPVRIVSFDETTFLVVDYSRRQILKSDPSGSLKPLIRTLGRPLSVTFIASYKKNGKLDEAYYFIGNDDARSIDVYYEDNGNGQCELIAQYPVGEDGIQALDMIYDNGSNQLFVVDGLEREIKVVSLEGDIVSAFGGGVLSDPKGIALDVGNGKAYISDYGDQVAYPAVPAAIEVFDLFGSHLSESKISGCNRFSRPQGLTLVGDKIYVADSMLAEIMELDVATGIKTASYGCRGSSEEHLLLPMDVVWRPGQKLYVADNRNMRITVLPLVQP